MDHEAEVAVQAAVESTLEEARRQADRIISEAVEHGLEVVTEAREKAAALDASTVPSRLDEIEHELFSGLDEIERRASQRTDALLVRLASSDDDADPREQARWDPTGGLTAEVSAVAGGNGARARTHDADLYVDEEDLVARVGGREIPITPVQARILDVLMAHPGQVVHRNTLLQRVWGTDNSLFNSAVERQVERLQQELEDDPAHPTRITSSSIGYRYRGIAADGVSDGEETR